jgi:AcrR family transcriptional regulator
LLLADTERPDFALMRTEAQIFCLILTTIGLETNNSVGVSPNIMDAVTSSPQSAVRPPQPAARRKAPAQRRAEMIEAASAIAVRDGLDKVTAKRVAAALGVRPGLVDHYFTADQLVAAAFADAASAESDEVFGEAEAIPDAPGQIRHLLATWLSAGHDPLSLLWLDAWQASRHRPALRDEVTAQMAKDIDRLTVIIQGGADRGEFTTAEPAVAAGQIFSLVDGLSVQAAIRGTIEYTYSQALVAVVTETILGVRLLT